MSEPTKCPTEAERLFNEARNAINRLDPPREQREAHDALDAAVRAAFEAGVAWGHLDMVQTSLPLPSWLPKEPRHE